MKFLSLISLMLLAAGCGKDQPAFKAQGSGGVETLSGKTTGEVLSAKYDVVQLKCGLWAEWNQPVTTDMPARELVNWDLLKDFSNEKTFELNAIIGLKQYIRVIVEVKKVEILAENNYTDTDGTRYVMSSTPQLTVRYQYGMNLGFKNGSSFASVGELKRNISERIWDRPMIVEDKLSESVGTLYTLVGCYLDTQAKPQFVDQYKVNP